MPPNVALRQTRPVDLSFVLLNVFAIEGDPFSGNQLAVFPEAAGLDEVTMQAWARQFNLSETTFVTGESPPESPPESPSELSGAPSGQPVSGDVRIFTASYEMPFAGHPTLGTAHVVAARAAARTGAPVEAVTLRMPAGAIPVRRAGGGWVLSANPPRYREPDVTRTQLAQALGTPADGVVDGAAQWVDCGVSSLVVQLHDVGALRTMSPVVTLFHEHLSDGGRPPHVYAWVRTGEHAVEARMFAASGSMLEEDPATGSACANLGGWFVGRGERSLEITVSQGAQTGRPSSLRLGVGAAGEISVGGLVTEVGSGHVAAATATQVARS
jgi:PhzF family phenazine biosynthesis protein